MTVAYCGFTRRTYKYNKKVVIKYKRRRVVTFVDNKLV